MKPAKHFLKGILPAAVICVCWYGVAWFVQLERAVPFPTPHETLLRLGGLLCGQTLLDHGIYRHLSDSLLRWAIGFCVAAAAGIVTGLASGWWRSAGTLCLPILHCLQLIPGLAWIPVALLLFGVGERATIFMIAMTAFSAIALNVADGVRRVDTTYIRAARMLGAGPRALFFEVLIPGALPAMITGLRVGLGNGWRVLVAGEMVVGTGTGLGFSIIEARWTLDYTSAFACVAIICLIGLAVEQLFFIRIEKSTVAKWALSRDAS